MSEFQGPIINRLEERIAAGAMSAAAVRVERRGELLLDWAGGTRKFDTSSPAINTDSVFQVASISKPMVTSGFAKLIERGLVDADDPVSKYVPEFSARNKENVTLHHCLTHSSGLPDMVPGNADLRKRNAPLSEFVTAVCDAELLYEPGTDVRYQSAGILMLAEVGERVTGMPYREYLAKEVFGPAGMESTHLGWREEYKDTRIDAKIEGTEDSSGWNHNSSYWCDLGAPWGGVHTNTADVAKLLKVLLAGGTSESGELVFGAGTVRSLVADYTSEEPNLSRATRLEQGWGLGWKLQRLANGGVYGSAVPAGSFGHWGASGTVAWADPVSGTSFVLLTNGLYDSETAAIKACGNIAASALCGV
jgi:CubicO group peptidase (beta-lactamase class C family)